MGTENPYATPKSATVNHQNDSEYSKIKLYTDKGRIGRLRYLLYIFGLLLVGILVAFGVYFIPTVGSYLAGFTGIIVFLVILNMTIQRCHDFNRSSVIALGVLIIMPIIGVIFFIIPGTKGKNKYGTQAPPNTPLIKIGAVIVATLLLIVIVSIMMLLM